MKSHNASPESPRVASAYKIASHPDKVAMYLRGQPIFPVSLELDLTSRCSRACRDCPSTRASDYWDLDKGFIERLFGILGKGSSGLLLTGGEPTLSPLFSYALAQARNKGFREIAVVSNGSRLDDALVLDALLEHVSVIRLSLYDWECSSRGPADGLMNSVSRLRKRVECEGSSLKVGFSILTSSATRSMLLTLTETAVAAGAHWIYFHPRCRGWEDGRPVPDDQEGVVETIEEISLRYLGLCDIQFSRERYQRDPLVFSSYHAAHFLFVVGADRRNYLGPEVKYHPDFVIGDLSNGFSEGFFSDPARRSRIDSYGSNSYRAVNSRHRGVLYNGFIERLQRGERHMEEFLPSPPVFLFPHIL